MTAHIWLGTRRANLRTASTFMNARFIATDGRQRLSNFWAPTGLVTDTEPKESTSKSHDASGTPRDNSAHLLAKAGFVRQVQSGVFHLLPLGLRVQNKLEALIDKHMSAVGAAKLSLSSISTEALWKKSGRLSTNSELLRINDRRKSGFLLAPTHEEEITSLVASTVQSYKDLPVRLYQIGRKYRDERRPRNGLLRAKEFMMKDLYTFDFTHEHALETYKQVRQAYNNLFDELKIPYTVADADSGNMGGKLSHEYHFIHPSGEDKIWNCNSCDYVANEELVEHGQAPTAPNNDNVMIFKGIDHHHKVQINIHIPVSQPKETYTEFDWAHYINPFAVGRALDELGFELATGLEPATLASLVPKTKYAINVVDRRLNNNREPIVSDSFISKYDIMAIRPGDKCPKCTTGQLNPSPGIEVAHTFHLGTRYSAPMDCTVATPSNKEKVPVQMGCHGIGVSRLIGSSAAVLSSPTGLNWPRAIAPFEVLLLSAPGISENDVNAVYDGLKGRGVDVVLDDREGKSIGWKLKDADLIGYPVILVMGKAWKEESGRKIEVQCRRLGIKGELMGQEEVKDGVGALLEKL